MKSDINEVALQGIEFWSNICEEEISLSVEAEECQEHGRIPVYVSRHYARGKFLHIWTIFFAVEHENAGN
ncbi:unnamed protein product [Gongylonema pulchrum]|uniref:Uncharacterized protein n=1 Tax=Gongylonema pulchrum TaxID=637853 RepID=A0A183DJW7_9BILA|nr:unnamed protein product [Gongylonema pulchrum]